MTTLVGVFFSLISVFGILLAQTKKAVRKFVLLLFSFCLIMAQLLYMYSRLSVNSQDFIAVSALVGAVILILSLQRNEAW